jgi:hypothetical protein
MVTKPNKLIEELEAIQSKDEVLVDVSNRCCEILHTLEAMRKLNRLNIFVVDFNIASKAVQTSAFHTDSLKVILEPPTIIVNAAFLFELEAAFRSFDLSDSLLDSQYLHSDEDIFGLIKRIKYAPAAYLARLRTLGKRESKRDDYIVETLTMVMLFFVSHEIGHLLDNVNQRHYATFLHPDAELEGRVANAVVKLCRHADEFEKYGFGLQGFQQVVDKTGEIREYESKLAKQIETLNTNHKKWFGDEISADRHGTDILIGYLDGVAKRDRFLADQYRYVTIKGLFTVALYSWYSDLLVFSRKMGIDGAPDSSSLTFRMMQDRETYIQASSLFGEVHRFTLLRATLAIEAIIRSGSDFFDRQDEGKTIWWSKERFDTDATRDDTRKWWQKIFVWRPEQTGEDQKTLQEWWQKEALQRYYLLCIMMDTAVKIANHGCATGWVLEVDQKRGTPQLFMMNFESIDAAVNRLRHLA